MNDDFLNTFILASSFIALFATAEILYHALKVRVEYTRKLVHVGTGLLSLLFPLVLGNHWLVLFLCISFAGILILSLKFNQLQSINAIDRESVGSLAYPVSVYSCYLAYDYYDHNYIFFYIPILILAICDPVAALTGKKWPKGKYAVGKTSKTLMGSSIFFISAFIICFFFFIQITGLEYIFVLTGSVVVAMVAAASEAFTEKGYDNITIPASVVSILMLFHFVLLSSLR